MKPQHYLLTILTAALLLFTTCEKPERNNPWDIKADPDDWAPKNLEFTVNSNNSVTLNWDYDAILPEGFIIDRKTGSGAWEEKFASINPNRKSFDDNNVNLTANSYSYRLYAYAGSNTSAKVEVQISTFEDVYSPATGKIWMDRNLGATRVAQSSTDSQAYGHLYQWGRAADGHQVRTSGTTPTLSNSDTPGHGNFITTGSSPYDWRSTQNDDLWQGVNGTNNPCPAGYRLPTEAEWNAEIQSWSSNDAAGAFGSPLKLPVAGYRLGSNGSLVYVGSSGGYWSSTVDGTISRLLYFSSSNANMYSSNRAYGVSVRCLKDD